MKAVTWQGRRSIAVEEVPDPRIEEPTDAIVRVTSSGICGSDLHLYEILGMYMHRGDILGHEPMGIVEEVGAAVHHVRPGDRVVIPFNISCGSCYFCDQQLFSQCETTQNAAAKKGGSLFGYTHLYGGIPGGQAEYLRVPCAHFGPIKVPDDGRPDERYLYMSDVLPTAWQGVAYADVPDGGSLVVLGLGPIGDMACRIAMHNGHRVIGVDLVPERLDLASKHGMETLDLRFTDDPTEAILEMTAGRGVDSGIDCVGMEAAGSVVDSILSTVKVQPDRLIALHNCMGSIRRGGTLSISGVYTGPFHMFPLGDLFDKQIAIRMGQANVKRWVDDILPLLNDDDPLAVGDLMTHEEPLDKAPEMYRTFQKKQDGCIKVVLKP